MDIIPNTKIRYLGDTNKALTLKGKALFFRNLVIDGMGNALSIVRVKEFGDGSAIRASITTEAYGTKNALLEVFCPIEGGDDNAVLFCTSFNEEDGGTQVYKDTLNIINPVTQGGLVTVDNNPTGLILPTPTYKCRDNYWVNEKETATVSWENVNTVIAGIPKVYGKIAINGVETGVEFGNGYTIYQCGLISSSRLMVIFRHTFDKDYMFLMDYVVSETSLNLTFVSSIDLTDLGYTVGSEINADGRNESFFYYGILDDACRTVIYERHIIGRIDEGWQDTHLMFYRFNEFYSDIEAFGTVDYARNNAELFGGDLIWNIGVRGKSIFYSHRDYTLLYSFVVPVEFPAYGYVIDTNHYGWSRVESIFQYKDGVKKIKGTKQSSGTGVYEIGINLVPEHPDTWSISFGIHWYQVFDKAKSVLYSTVEFNDYADNNINIWNTYFNGKVIFQGVIIMQVYDYCYTQDCLIVALKLSNRTNNFDRTIVYDVKKMAVKVHNKRLEKLSVTKLPAQQ